MKPPQRAVGVKWAEKGRMSLKAPLFILRVPLPRNRQPHCGWLRGSGDSGFWFIREGKECALYRPLLVCLTFTAGKGATPLEIRFTLQGLPVA